VVGGTARKGPDVRPTHLRIPAIDVSATITPLGIHPDRTVEVPENPDQAGWYRLGSLPGQSGSAVILGHVDSTRGPAVFYRLRSLSHGDQITVRASDGSVTRFRVTSIATYPNQDFPAQKVYRTTGSPGLALVTCGGSYDRARGGYQANVVVYADLVGAPPR
jgi:LPXTG-site transpeptidase (sortase) family protein